MQFAWRNRRSRNTYAFRIGGNILCGGATPASQPAADCRSDLASVNGHYADKSASTF